ncbi:hypothetical protein PT974_04302 [Cladobotryum mycophilum]|uniref:Uncharacterized protein n=1 Tax=Cladobotryum mycophilum TaxID=491253 RepID=A0ABR0SV50_9HYPO
MVLASYKLFGTAFFGYAAYNGSYPTMPLDDPGSAWGCGSSRDRRAQLEKETLRDDECETMRKRTLCALGRFGLAGSKPALSGGVKFRGGVR